MATYEDIKHLATLARIFVSEQDLPKLSTEFESILKYIGQLESLAVPESSDLHVPPLRNVFRDDKNPTPSGANTQKIINAFPKRNGNALSVKKIITHE
ncbi:MAG TPA: aspartyl/glutamyl-tRNA amidotransferase subunit C [Candidatus Kaiserbacteria bacterium]|nr:aspartyl/glutamyl-tRNA amidotransferase subunit C [Candidatus Kaiserbacteria bacterium]